MTLVDRIALGAAAEATRRLLWVRDDDARWKAIVRFWSELGVEYAEAPMHWAVN